MRQSVSFEVVDELLFLEQLRRETTQHRCALLLETAIEHRTSTVGGMNGLYDVLAGFGAVEKGAESLDELQVQQSACNDWWFGYLTYDLKNRLEPLQSQNEDGIGLPEMFFFRPRWLVVKDGSGWRVGFMPPNDTEESAREWLLQVMSFDIDDPHALLAVEMESKVAFGEYCRNVKALQRHIARGDIYEANYCIEYYSKDVVLDPVGVYGRLARKSPVPFGALGKFGDAYLLSASPERYVCKRGSRLVSQPIKGTAQRGAGRLEDAEAAEQLRNDEKERAENIMITDLVRNDLARVAKRGSVTVDELCGVYAYKQVFQMVSTVSAELEYGLGVTDVIKATFPMGSMTGAPKRRAMELIEHYETSKRGLYSGAVGYIAPNGDFDFNVVIRSILYNRSRQYLSFMVGSAITAQAKAEDEYNECLLKAKAMVQVLGGG